MASATASFAEFFHLTLEANVHCKSIASTLPHVSVDHDMFKDGNHKVHNQVDKITLRSRSGFMMGLIGLQK
jgi:hypothetical protein